uniref:ATG11 domain-containing protein n=1 Tax=Angiostrongylus cantonensis TaxID=6313 RepID=A0A0K0D607_ANGCA
MQYEAKLSQQEFNFSLKWLVAERDRLKDYIIKNSSEGRAFCEAVENEIQSAIASSEGSLKFVYGASIATQTEVPQLLSEGEKVCTSQPEDMKESALAFECLPELLESAGVSDYSSCINNQRNEVQIQTKISLQTMDRMIAIQDIDVGSTVLAIWNIEHNSYMLFSSSSYNYFVKESSVLRFGLSAELSNVPRRNWILAKVSRLEFCIVRKADNRYHLPVNTKMYRVEVKPVDL